MNAQVKIPDLAELVVIDDKDALATFTTPGALDPILAHVRKHIDAFQGDASTPEGRAEIKSMAFAVTKSKTALKSVGDRLAREAKDLPKKIDAGRRKVEDTLDAWRDEVRKPLTEWEAAEAARIERHNHALEALKAVPAQPDVTVEEISAALAEVESVSDGEDREEFQDGFRFAKAAALAFLREKLASRQKYDAEQAELTRFRAEAEAREAEDRKRREAEAAAQAKRDREAAIAAAAAEAEQRAREAAEKATREAIEAAERRAAQAKEQAAEAERRAAEAEQRARAHALAEAKRQADAARAEAEARERNREHRGKINRAAVDALAETGIPEEHAKIAIAAIAKGAIPAVRIIY